MHLNVGHDSLLGEGRGPNKKKTSGKAVDKEERHSEK